MRKLIISILFSSIFIIVHSQYNNDILVEPILKTDTNSLGQKIEYPNFTHDEVTILKITIFPGKSTGWHKHEFPVFAYVLKGSLTVDFENNKSLQFTENSSFIEVVDMNHNGSNKGNENLVLIAFYLGEKGKGLSIKK